MMRLYRLLVFSVLSRASGNAFCKIYNTIMIFNGGRKRCKLLNELYYLSDGSANIVFTRPSRYRYYSDGINYRLKDLFVQYTGGRVEIRKGDVVIDCGANIGEFSKFCTSRQAVVFAFEPDPRENCALSKNLNGLGSVFSQALWFENTKLGFKLQNITGDSTVTTSEGDGARVEVDGKRLDSFSEIKAVSRIRLLKLEAEGFELEVLQGATDIIDKIEFIAADLGPERGPDNESSLPQVVNYLQTKGFDIEHFFPIRSIALFKNKALID